MSKPSNPQTIGGVEKLSIRYHAGNPSLCKIPELKIIAMPECEGGGYALHREQAEAIVEAASTIEHQLSVIGEYKAALEFYANPEIYKPHPHGSAFDVRDVSFRARKALSADTDIDLDLETGELRPCPFCGGEAERMDIDEEGENFGGSCICCKKCGASSPVHFDRKENLESSWNERALSHPIIGDK